MSNNRFFRKTWKEKSEIKRKTNKEKDITLKD